jgi:DNA-binding IclR family transcriptional regulator
MMLIKSVGVSFSILKAFVGRRSALTLKEIGYQSKLPPSKAHRYLQSLIREGMVVQDRRTRQYRLGPTAISFGLEALEHSDPVVSACELLRDVAQTEDVGASVDVFSAMGPICIWYEQGPSYFGAPVRLGSIQSMETSAAGQVFQAFLPEHISATAAKACKRGAEGAISLPPSVADAPASAKARGYAIVDSGAGYGVSCAAPVFDARGEICAAVSLFAAAGEEPSRIDALLLALLGVTQEASEFKRFVYTNRLARAL